MPGVGGTRRIMSELSLAFRDGALFVTGLGSERAHSSMSERLVQLVYGTACFIAAVALCLAVYAATDGTVSGWYTLGILAGGGVLIWMVGRAIRHALTPARKLAERPRQGHE